MPTQRHTEPVRPEPKRHRRRHVQSAPPAQPAQPVNAEQDHVVPELPADLHVAGVAGQENHIEVQHPLQNEQVLPVNGRAELPFNDGNNLIVPGGEMYMEGAARAAAIHQDIPEVEGAAAILQDHPLVEGAAAIVQDGPEVYIPGPAYSVFAPRHVSVISFT